MRFTFDHLTYEVPPDVDIVVRSFEEHGAWHLDFDFAKDGEVVAMLGGTGMNGETLPTWDDIGIRQIKKEDG